MAKKRRKPTPQFDAQANAIATALCAAPAMVGIDFVSILAIVTPVLQRLFGCLKPDTPDEVVEAVASKWDPVKGYKPGLLNHVSKEVMEESRGTKKRFAKQQALATATGILDHVRLSQREVVGSCVAELGA